MQPKRVFVSRYAGRAQQAAAPSPLPVARDKAEQLVLEAHGARVGSPAPLEEPEWVKKGDFAPPPERVNMDAGNFVANAGPPVTPANIDSIPVEAQDTPEERRRLLAILREDRNLSGLSGYEILDRHRIPPSTLELAIIEGQVARAERGWGLGRRAGGPW